MKDKKELKDILNIVRCEGAVCVSSNDNYRRYYADNITRHRKIKMEKYYYK